MKNKLISGLLCLISSFSFSQSYVIPDFPIDSLTGKISYKEVVYLDSTVQQQVLYLAAREWFAKKFVSSNDVLQMEDEKEGILIGKGSFLINGGIFGDLPFPTRFTISMYFKNGKYKYELTDLFKTDGECEFFLDILTGKTKNQGYSKKQIANQLNQVHNNSKAILNDFKTTMLKANKINNDW